MSTKSAIDSYNKKMARYKRDVPGTVFTQPSQTDQSAADQVDITRIMKRHHSGEIVQLPPQSPLQYGDFSDIPTYHDALSQIVAAQQSFENLPSQIRTRFQNDPHQLLEFLSDPKNIPEARELGILNKLPPENLPNPPSPANPPQETTVDKPESKK